MFIPNEIIESMKIISKYCSKFSVCDYCDLCLENNYHNICLLHNYDPCTWEDFIEENCD